MNKLRYIKPEMEEVLCDMISPIIKTSQSTDIQWGKNHTFEDDEEGDGYHAWESDALTNSTKRNVDGFSRGMFDE